MLAVAFGQILARERRIRCLTQDQLATRAGLTRRYVQYLERGHRMARLGTLLRLAAALDLEPAALLRGLVP